MSIFVTVLLILVAASPILLKVLQRLGLEVSNQQYELLRKSIDDAVSHVSKVTDNKDIPGEEKKALAIKLAKTIASKNGVSEERQELVADLIESILWKHENVEIDEEDAY